MHYTISIFLVYYAFCKANITYKTYQDEKNMR